MPSIPSAELLAQLTTLSADTTSLHAPQVVLDTNSPPLSGSVIAVGSLVAPTFAGYAAVSPATWGSPFVNAAGQAEMLGPVCTFACTASGGTNTITAAVLLNTAGTKIILYDALDTPIGITNAGDGWSYIPRWVMGVGA